MSGKQIEYTYLDVCAVSGVTKIVPVAAPAAHCKFRNEGRAATTLLIKNNGKTAVTATFVNQHSNFKNVLTASVESGETVEVGPFTPPERFNDAQNMVCFELSAYKSVSLLPKRLGL